MPFSRGPERDRSALGRVLGLNAAKIATTARVETAKRAQARVVGDIERWQKAKRWQKADRRET